MRPKLLDASQATYVHEMKSPVGKLTLLAGDEGLKYVLWERDRHGETVEASREWIPKKDHPVLGAARAQLAEYFAGERMKFDIPLAPEGTPFQLRVWMQLRKIGYGQTMSYQQQAEALGGPTYCRAVGGANGKNPISIIVPCHRVIGKNGSMTGFGGGIENKVALLSFEREQLKRLKKGGGAVAWTQKTTWRQEALFTS